MIELYHRSPARSVRVLWTLEEVGADYRLRAIEMPVREMQPEYLRINPAGLFPTAVDDGEILTESLSICDHIARKYGGGTMAPDPDDPDYRRYLQYLLFGEATLGAPLSNIMRYGPNQPRERQAPHVVEEGKIAYEARLHSLETGLNQGPFILGERFSLADVSVGYMLWLSKAFLGLGPLFGPKTAAYLDSLTARPAFQRTVAA